MLARVIRRVFCQSAQTTYANQFTIENDLENLKKQLTWRASNMGMRELDLLLGTFAKDKLKSFSKDELVQFNKDVLILETPVLNKILLGQLPIPDGNKFIPIVIEYAKNKPKYVYF
ncbi:hypothetical protein ABPG72_018870 [Tetrahymena utriculariae]